MPIVIPRFVDKMLIITRLYFAAHASESNRIRTRLHVVSRLGPPRERHTLAEREESLDLDLSACHAGARRRALHP